MTPNYFTSQKSPYYIFAPEYRASSAGIRALHALCHALNEMGFEAYIANPVSTFNPQLITPPLDQRVIERHKHCKLNPIAVYPEVVNGNPFNLPTVARWMLNKPGHLSGHTNFGSNEMVFWWDTWMSTDQEVTQLLQFPLIDRSIFYPPQEKDKRRGFCYYANKYFLLNRSIPDGITEKGTRLCQDVPLTRLEIAEILRKSETLFTYEPTCLAGEAVACGCKVAYVDSEYLNEFNLNQSHSTPIPVVTESQIEDGFSPEIDLNIFDRHLTSIEKSAANQLKAFISITQKTSKANKHGASFERIQEILFSRQLHPAPKKDDLYDLWRNLDTSDIIRSKVLATNMVTNWKDSPSIHFFTTCTHQEHENLNRTLHCLSNQVFKSWMITVISTESQPTNHLDNFSIQWLQARQAADCPLIIHELAKASGGTWVGFITPGVQLEALALQAMMDASMHNPCWELIYCDDDIQTEAGQAYRPRFKPKPDFLTLCGTTLVDGLSLIRQTTYCIEVSSPIDGHSPAYVVALKLASEPKSNLIGHIHGVWAHVPEESISNSNKSERQAAETAIATRFSQSARIINPDSGNLRVVMPLPEVPDQQVAIVVFGAKTLEACITQWRSISSVQGNQRTDVCFIANCHLSAANVEMLRLATTSDPGFPTQVIDLLGLNEGDALAELCLRINQPLIWILGEGALPAQPDTLDQLISWISWPNVGAVQSGLLDVRTNRMICPGLAPALGLLGMPLAPETIGNSPTQQRILSALNESGALMRTCQLRHLLQMMTPNDRTAWQLVLSKMLTNDGYQMVWRPEAICVATPARQQHLDNLDTLFVERNLLWLTSDGAYNPQLSLRRPALVDPQRCVPWVDLPSTVRRCLLLQEDGLLFPQEHLKNLGTVGEYTDTSMSLWTVSESDSDSVLFLEIVRARPDAVFFAQYSANGKLTRALSLLEKYAPSMQRVCCVTAPTIDPNRQESWTLIDWLVCQQQALRNATKVLTTQSSLAETLHPYHSNIHVIPPPSGSDDARHSTLSNLYL